MTGTDVATRDTSTDLTDGDRRRLNALYRECQRLAASKLVPKALEGDADTVFALARYGEMYGLPPIHAVQRLYVIEGKIEPSAEVLAGMVMDAGNELRWDDISSDRCTVSIRRRDADYFQTLTWTLEDARRAGLLDVWVERRVQDGTWADSGKPRYRTEKVVVGDDLGVDAARVAAAGEWAQKLVEDGQVKRNENWHRYPGDMLAAKALRRAAKRFCSDALLALTDEGDGMDVADLVAPVRTPVTATVADELGGDPDDDDDPVGAPPPDPEVEEEIEDAELVVDPQPPVEDDATADDAGRHAQAIKRLMVTCGKAFPEPDAPKGQKTARQRLLRRAAQYAVIGAHRSATNLTIDELAKVEAWVHAAFVDAATVTPTTYEILDDDTVRFTRGDKTKDIPPPAAGVGEAA